MNWKHWIRQVHRWTSLVFATLVFGIFIAMAFGKEPAEWIYLLPLAPLFILLASGLYMFVLPYLGQWTGAKPSHVPE